MIKRVIKNIVSNDYMYSIIVTILGVFIATVLSVITARFFNPDLKGISAIIENDISLYAVILELGIHQAYPFYRKTRKDLDVYTVFSNHFFSMFAVYQLLAICIASFMIINNINIYLAVAILLMPSEVYTKQLNYIVLIEHPRRRNTNSLIISISEIAVILVLIVFTSPSVPTVIAYCCITKILRLILSFVNLRKNPLSLRFDFSMMKELIKFSIITMFVLLCMTINYKIDIQMLKWFDNVSYADIGIYSIGVSIATKIWLIPDAMKDILLSRIVKGKGGGEVAQVLRINLSIVIVAILMLTIVGKPIISLLYGANYDGAYTIMVMMMIGVWGMTIYKMIYSYNIANGKRAINLIFLGGAAIINVILNLIVIPYFGIYGAACASIVSYSFCGISFLVQFHKETKIPFSNLLLIQKSDINLFKSFLKK